MKGSKKKVRSVAEAVFEPTPEEKQRIAAEIQDTILDDGLTLLDVNRREVEALPKIEHLFKAIGGSEKVFEFLEGSEEPEARAILEARRRLTTAQAKCVPFEAYCLAANIAPKKAFGIISQEVMEQSAKASALISRARHPEVVEYTIEQALTPAGAPERKMLHQSAGFLPMPKGNVNVFGGVAIDNRHQEVNVAVLPPVEDSVKRMSDRFGEMAVPPLTIEAADNNEEEGGDEN